MRIGQPNKQKIQVGNNDEMVHPIWILIVQLFSLVLV